MRFKVENNWLLKTEEFIELDPKNFLYCASIEELNEAVEDFIHDRMKFPNMEKNYVVYEECLGTRFYDNFPFETLDAKSFYLEWQKLKGLPEEL